MQEINGEPLSEMRLFVLALWVIEAADDDNTGVRKTSVCSKDHVG